MSGERERLITNAYNVVTGDGGVATPEEALDALNRLWDAALSVVDEAKLAEVIGAASLGYNLSDRSGESYACGAPDYRSLFVARAVVEYLRGER